MATLLVTAGCSKKSSVETAPLEKNFKSADSASKSVADKAVSEIKAENYGGALTELQKLGAQAKLTPEQQQAIKDVTAQIQQALVNAGKKAADDVSKSATDLQKSLGK
ncbi:MAG: hypothetical protein JWQ71_2946 [Pedosphaera sp.]|nr:hypothetical protein [Pedosphaera sp.]